MIVKLLIDGGDMKPNPAIAQQLGPLGINIGKVITDVNNATKDFKGMNLPVNLDIDQKTKNYEIIVLSPPTSQLIKKELNVELASGERKKFVIGNLAIEQVISVTKVKQKDMLAKDFVSALKSVIGSCMSLGVLIENKEPKEVLEEIEQGTYKIEIESQKTEVSPEKKQKLDEFFSVIQVKQDDVKKKDKEAEEAKKESKLKAAQQPPKATTPAKKK